MALHLDLASEALRDLRSWFETAWRFSHENYVASGQNFFENKRAEVPAILCGDMCRHTSLAVQRLLAEADGGGWKSVGGFMRQRKPMPDMAGKRHPYGEWYVDADGTAWLQHWWLEKDGVRIDLACEAFGWEDVNVSSVDDDRYRPEQALSKQRFLAAVKGTVDRWTGPVFDLTPERERSVRTSFVTAKEIFIRNWGIVRGTDDESVAIGKRR